MYRMRFVVELDLNDQAVTENGIDRRKLLEGARLESSDGTESCRVIMDLPPWVKNVNDLLSGSPRLVSGDLLPGPSKDDYMQDCRDLVREDIAVNGTICYGLTLQEVQEMIENEHPAVEALTKEAYLLVVNRGKLPEKAVHMVMDKFGRGYEDIRAYGHKNMGGAYNA